MTTTSIPDALIPVLQNDKHLRNDDSVWILTDVEAYDSSFYGYSDPQLLFKVGVYDLITKRIGFATFGKDMAYSMLKAGLAPPPWKTPQPLGVTLHRHAHDDEPKGRYLTTATLVPIEPLLHSVVAPARAIFVAMKHWPNAYLGIWEEQEKRATRDNAIECAVLQIVGLFSAGDIRKACGASAAEVTLALKKLVAEGKLLPPTGTKRGTKYRVA
jgi:hypothetical protein